ncbi:hypothetical protein AwErysi_09420 [Erysipelotrichaceae bacterium]|nr:hypothetical protein AwErysi_09420 [Erysipelotrichaceae bacterium]
MDEVKKWAQEMQTYALPRWENLPNIELYMDQVVEVVEKQLQPLFLKNQAKIITATMINNYVKLELISKPVKKRYQRKHIASIITITILKQILPISAISKSIKLHTERFTADIAYDMFCTEIEYGLQTVGRQILGEHIVQGLKQTESLELKMAAIAFSSKNILEKILIREQTDKKDIKKQNSEQKERRKKNGK